MSVAEAVIGVTLGTIEILLAQAGSMRTLKAAGPRIFNWKGPLP